MAFEIVNRRGHEIASFLAGTNGVNFVTDREERLERHHDFVVFDEVADNHQDPPGRHGLLQARFF
jgi:hypothetical protein